MTPWRIVPAGLLALTASLICCAAAHSGEAGPAPGRSGEPNFWRVIPFLQPPPNIIPPTNPGRQFNQPLAAPQPPHYEAPSPRLRATPLARPPVSGGMVMTIDKILSEKSAAPPPGPLIGRPRQAAEQLAACWSPPVPASGETVEVTLRFSFDGAGSVKGAPRITYVKPPPGGSADAVRQSILAAVKGCTPLRFTADMARNMPGYPLAVRFIGRRPPENGASRP